MDHLLSWLVFIPLIASIVMLLVPKSQDHLYKWVALVALAMVLVLSVMLVYSFDKNVVGYGAESLQFIEQLDWIQFCWA